LFKKVLDTQALPVETRTGRRISFTVSVVFASIPTVSSSERKKSDAIFESFSIQVAECLADSVAYLDDNALAIIDGTTAITR
jgi:hypothetical protein